MLFHDFSMLVQDVVVSAPCGVQMLARRVGKTYPTLMREVNPYDKGAKLGADTLLNIMLVSITERTREIGTRKALGARRGDIRLQFITEAVVICLVGGALGVALGVALGSVGTSLLGYAAKPSLSAILVAVGFSMAIGVFFGYYPANKAAKLDPIEALRYE